MKDRGGGDPYNTAAPSAFKRIWFDIEPELSEWLTAEAKRTNITKRALLRKLVIDARGKSRGK